MVTTLERIEQDANDRGEERWFSLFDRAVKVASERLSEDGQRRAARWVQTAPTDPPRKLPEPFRAWWRTLMNALRRFEVDGGLPASVSPPPPIEAGLWTEAVQAAEDGDARPLVILSFARVHRRITTDE